MDLDDYLAGCAVLGMTAEEEHAFLAAAGAAGAAAGGASGLPGSSSTASSTPLFEGAAFMPAAGPSKSASYTPEQQRAIDAAASAGAAAGGTMASSTMPGALPPTYTPPPTEKKSSGPSTGDWLKSFGFGQRPTAPRGPSAAEAAAAQEISRNRTILIGVGVTAGLGLVGTAIYFLTRRK